MIRWCRESARPWAEHWLRTWTTTALASERTVTSALLDLSAATDDLFAIADHRAGEIDDWPQRIPLPAPGGRVVLVLRAPVGDDRPVRRPWLELLAGRGLVPEISHRCEPLPGDPVLTSKWLRANAVSGIDGAGPTVGCVLARRLTEPHLRDRTLELIHDTELLPLYFGLDPGAAVPLPLPAGRYRLPDLAAGFCVPARDVTALLDELVWAGALRPSRPDRAPRAQGPNERHSTRHEAGEQG
jgi:hypothetical protein